MAKAQPDRRRGLRGPMIVANSCTVLVGRRLITSEADTNKWAYFRQCVVGAVTIVVSRNLHEVLPPRSCS